MSLQDKAKWDKKYLEKEKLLLPRDPSKNLVNYLKQCSGKRALDLACGAGRNTIYLAKQGFSVDALDIAKVALDTLSKELKKQNLEDMVNIQLCDLDDYEIKKDAYDLVLMFNFLDRKLLEKSKQSLSKDGIYIVETYMVDETNEKKNSLRSNMLEKEELKEIFSDGFEIVFYEEFENEAHELYRMKKQMIVARKL
jgi:cyclopropane fatty-acyl-phospholipid synthase-like methyltransferase